MEILFISCVTIWSVFQNLVIWDLQTETVIPKYQYYQRYSETKESLNIHLQSIVVGRGWNPAECITFS